MSDRSKRTPGVAVGRAFARPFVGRPTFDYRQAQAAGWTVERYRFGRRLDATGPQPDPEPVPAPVTY